MRRDLLAQLRTGKLLPPAKEQLIRLLGEVRAEEATNVLIRELNFKAGPEQIGPDKTIKGGYVARKALVSIGGFAATAILGAIECTSVRVGGEECFDKTQIDGMIIVIYQIRGPKPALQALQEWQARTTDAKAKAQFQMVIDRYKALFPDAMQ